MGTEAAAAESLKKAKGPKIKKICVGNGISSGPLGKGRKSPKKGFSLSEKASLSSGAKTSIRAPFDNQCIKSFSGGNCSCRTIQWYAHLRKEGGGGVCRCR